MPDSINSLAVLCATADDAGGEALLHNGNNPYADVLSLSRSYLPIIRLRAIRGNIWKETSARQTAAFAQQREGG